MWSASHADQLFEHHGFFDDKKEDYSQAGF